MRYEYIGVIVMASGESYTDGSGGGTSSAKEKLTSFRKFAAISYTRARQVSCAIVLCQIICV